MQFERIVKADPTCAMAHWGLAMSSFHQIWDRPSAEGMKFGWEQMQAAEALPVKTQREKDYIAALAEFFQAGQGGVSGADCGLLGCDGEVVCEVSERRECGGVLCAALLAEKSPD